MPLFFESKEIPIGRVFIDRGFLHIEEMQNIPNSTMACPGRGWFFLGAKQNLCRQKESERDSNNPALYEIYPVPFRKKIGDPMEILPPPNGERHEFNEDSSTVENTDRQTPYNHSTIPWTLTKEKGP